MSHRSRQQAARLCFFAVAAALGCARGPGAQAPAAQNPAAPASTSSLAEPSVDYRNRIESAIEAALVHNPVWATAMGDHRFDNRWPAIDRAAEARWANDLRTRAAELRQLAERVPQRGEPERWGTDRPALDARVLADHFESNVLSRTRARAYFRDPSVVVSLIGSGITSIVSHDYAPKAQRLGALSGRLEDVPDLLKTARARLEKPTRPSLENLAIIAPGVSDNLRSRIAKTPAAELGGDQALADRLSRAATLAADAIDAYAKEVATTFNLDKASDDPIGEKLWSELARLGEGVSEPASAVRKLGESELIRLASELDKLMQKSAKRGETRAAFYARLQSDAPEPATLLDEYRRLNRGVEEWLRSVEFVSVPWQRVKLEIVPTPPERRGTSFASMNVAGPLEPRIADAHFEVNVPDARMPADRKAALISFHARGAIELISVHEALPGHYLQNLWQRQSPSKVRKLFWAATTGEGWAHYCEEAVVDAGYAGTDATRTRAFMLRMALQRATRVVVDVGANDGSLSLDAATKLLEEQAFLAPAAARIEARRAFVAPANMFSYTYGKLAIRKLREEVSRREAAAFKLASFHDRLLSVGAVPVRYLGAEAFGIAQ